MLHLITHRLEVSSISRTSRRVVRQSINLLAHTESISKQRWRNRTLFTDVVTI